MKDVRPVAQIHDELIFEIDEKLVEKISPKIKEIMESVLKLNPIDTIFQESRPERDTRDQTTGLTSDKKKLKTIPLLVEPKIGEN